MAIAAAQGAKSGLFVVTVIVITLPASPGAGVYVNEKGELPVETGETVPAPFSVNVTAVALPPNILPVTVTGEVPHVLPELLERTTVGGFTHPHDTSKEAPVVVQPDELRTVIV